MNAMKKSWLWISLLIGCFIIQHVDANTRKTITLTKCTDGDTAHFLIDGKDTTVRFLAIDTPEYTKEKEPYGKEASTFTCDALKQANEIQMEYDDGSDKTDKYGRDLAWIFVDDKLLQKMLVEEGLAEVAYLYGDYAYTDELKESQEMAKAAKRNIWSDEETVPSYITYGSMVIGAIIIVILLCSNTKGKKSKIKKVLKTMKQ